MIIYKTIEELKKDVVDDTLNTKDNISIEFDLDYEELNIYAEEITANNIKAADIKALDIGANNITAYDITANNINAEDIYANNITANNITANNINAYDINAEDIGAYDIKAEDINANNITAEDVAYYAVCFAYNNIKCKSIKGRRANSKHFCLDGELTFKPGDKVKVVFDG